MSETNRKPMLIGSSTYGYYYPEQTTFRCTHGGWESQVVILNEHLCRVHAISGVCSYKFLEAIPEGYGDDYEPSRN